MVRSASSSVRVRPGDLRGLRLQVRRLHIVHQRKPELVPFEPKGTDYLLNPIYQTVLRDALERMTARHEAEAEKATGASGKNGEPT
jgi:hypothetical protein